MDAIDKIPKLINNHQEEEKRNGEITQGRLTKSTRL